MSSDWKDNGEWLLAQVPVTGKTVLDIGCGDGWASVEMSIRGAQVVGTDLSSVPPVLLIENRIPYQQIPTANYDIGWCHHVLEHIQDPILFLQELHERIDQLWVTVPEEIGHGFAKGHINRYNMQLLIEHLRRAGWNVERGSYIARAGNLTAVVRSDLLWGDSLSPYPASMSPLNDKGTCSHKIHLLKENWPPEVA